MNCLIIILSIIIILFFIVDHFNKNEHFRYCSNCNNLGERSCYNCENCGWCIDSDFNGNCKQGDHYGPYFSNNCKEWYYSGNKIYPQPFYRRGFPRISLFDYNKEIPIYYKPTRRRFFPRRRFF